MITQKVIQIYGMIGIMVMSVLLALVWFKVVHPSLYLPLFLLALAVFTGRLILRVLYARQERSKDKSPP